MFTLCLCIRIIILRGHVAMRGCACVLRDCARIMRGVRVLCEVVRVFCVVCVCSACMFTCRVAASAVVLRASTLRCISFVKHL